MIGESEVWAGPEWPSARSEGSELISGTTGRDKSVKLCSGR